MACRCSKILVLRMEEKIKTSIEDEVEANGKLRSQALRAEKTENEVTNIIAKLGDIGTQSSLTAYFRRWYTRL